MMRGSITCKLLLFIFLAFAIATLCILFLAHRNLTRIIDTSQDLVYAEKTETILGELERNDERLRKTGLVEAYSADFQKAAHDNLRSQYYKDGQQRVYLFIIDMEGRVVMHPTLTAGDVSLRETDIVKRMLVAPEGSFHEIYEGQEKWYFFKKFPQWGWIVCYAVPLDIKYADSRKFLGILSMIMAGISMAVLVALSLIVSRFTRPISKLTEAAVAISEGELDHPIDAAGNDEVGVLGRAFVRMRDSIQQTISDLEKENRERQQAEQKLIDQNEYITNIFESVSHPLYAIDINDYSIQIANTASGLTAGAKSTCHALTHHRNTPCEGIDHPCPLSIVKQTQRPTMVEHTHFGPNGEPRTVEVYAYPVFDNGGNLVQMIEYTIDVTARQKAVAALSAEKERLAVTLRSIGDGVITTDIDGNVMLMNKIAENLTGWLNEEAVGRPLGDVFRIVNELTRDTCENPVAKVLATGQIVGLANHTVLIARDGTERSIADSGAPIRGPQSNIVGVVLVFRDVSEQIKTEKELLKIKKLEAVGVLAGGIAHDFNNILAAILGNINLSLLDATLTAKTKRLLSEAEKASLRAKDLTQQLLTFAKGGEPLKETSSLENVIKDSANFVLHGGKARCHYDIPSDLWMVDIDKGQISQVVQNIVLNARHAMPEGGDIRIHCQNLISLEGEHIPVLPEGRFVKIAIQDNGIGIPANLLEKIFDPYFTTKQEGSGLGLAISQSVINKHNGYITARSSPRKGSTFIFYLPASEKNEISVEDEILQQPSSTPAKILLMDDEEMLRDIGIEMLTHLGHEAIPSTDGNQVIKMYLAAMEKGEPFDMVIMDLTIPGGMGGKETIHHLLEIDPLAKVVVCSGYSTDPVMAHCEKYGFRAAISKPFRLHELSRVINQLL